MKFFALAIALALMSIAAAPAIAKPAPSYTVTESLASRGDSCVQKTDPDAPCYVAPTPPVN
jgi:hypothetical protein